LTSYTNDDKAFWKELRRELVKEGYSSTALEKHKAIKDYVRELGTIGALDELSLGNFQDGQEADASSSKIPSCPHPAFSFSKSASATMLPCLDRVDAG
jgi:hypothetical protein